MLEMCLNRRLGDLDRLILVTDDDFGPLGRGRVDTQSQHAAEQTTDDAAAGRLPGERLGQTIKLMGIH